MLVQQQKLILRPNMEIYELVVPKDNLLRKIKELVDFNFIYDELIDGVHRNLPIFNKYYEKI